MSATLPELQPRFPLEIFLTIVDYLDVEDLKSCALVCRFLHSVCRKSLFSEIVLELDLDRVELEMPAHARLLELFERTPKLAHDVQALGISFMDVASREDARKSDTPPVLAILEALQNVRLLVLRDVRTQYPAWLQIRFSPMLENALRALAGRCTLESLQVIGFSDVLPAFFTPFPELRHLSMRPASLHMGSVPNPPFAGARVQVPLLSLSIKEALRIGFSQTRSIDRLFFDPDCVFDLSHVRRLTLGNVTPAIVERFVHKCAPALEHLKIYVQDAFALPCAPPILQDLSALHTLSLVLEPVSTGFHMAMSDSLYSATQIVRSLNASSVSDVRVIALVLDARVLLQFLGSTLLPFFRALDAVLVQFLALETVQVSVKVDRTRRARRPASAFLRWARKQIEDCFESASKKRILRVIE